MGCRRARSLCGRMALVLVTSLSLPVGANGMFVTPTQATADAGRPSAAAQKAVLIQDGDEEILLLRTTYAGPASAFAWVVPVPSVPTEVFEAEPALLHEAFTATNPRVVSRVELDAKALLAQARDGMVAGEAAAEDGAGPAMPPPTAQVTVHQRLEVGDYDATVLSAEGSDALVKWLEDNGYETPDNAAEAVDPYVEQGFSFVAVRFLQEVAEARPTVTDVAPLGIRFPTERLYFPLRISRASAPALTSVLLCIFADDPVECDSLPCVWLPEREQGLGRGETYGALRRKLTRPASGAALLCEYSADGALAWSDLSPRAEDWADPDVDTGLPDRVCTRYYGLIAVEEMEDLWFSPAPGRPRDYRVLLKRVGKVSGSAWASWRDWQNNRFQWAKARESAGGGAASAAVLPPAVAVAASSAVDPASDEAPTALARWPLLAAVCAVPLLGAGAVLLLVRRRRAAAGASLMLCLFAVASAALVRPSLAGMGGDEGTRQLESELTALDEALQAFVKDAGCCPLALGDLVATSAPSEGLDVSGNTVPLRGEWQGPYLPSLPPDLLGGELAYDVLNLRPVDSSGWKTTFRGATEEHVAAAWAEVRGPETEWSGRKALPVDPHAPTEAREPAKPSYWGGPSDRQRENHALYQAWLADGARGRLVAGPVASSMTTSGGVGPEVVMGVSTVVAAPGSGECFTLAQDVACVDPGDGTAYALRPWFRGAQKASGRTGVFRTARDGALQRAMDRPLEGQVAARATLSADGTQAAFWGNVYHSEGADAILVGPVGGKAFEVTRGRFVQVEFAPGGDALYALGWLEEDYADLRERWHRDGLWKKTRGRGSLSRAVGLIRIPLDGGEPEVLVSDLAANVLSASRLGVLVYDGAGQLLLVGYDGSAPQAVAIPDGKFVRTARAFDTGIAYVLASEDMTSGHQYGDAPWLAQVLVLDGPGAPVREAAVAKLTSRTEIGILGLDAGGAITVAWHSDMRGTAPWVVKHIARDGTAAALTNRALPDDRWGAGDAAEWETSLPGWGDVTASEGACLP